MMMRGAMIYSSLPAIAALGGDIIGYSCVARCEHFGCPTLRRKL